MNEKLKTYRQWALVRMSKDGPPYIGDFLQIHPTLASAKEALGIQRRLTEPGEYRKYGRLRIACLQVCEVDSSPRDAEAKSARKSRKKTNREAA